MSEVSHDVGKYTGLAHDAKSSHSRVIAMVPRGASVLEFGCATGYVSSVLTEQLGCAVTGVEVFPAAAELARPKCRRVIVGDAESMDLAQVLGDEKFDVVLFGDVLEHLRDPAALLVRIRPYLAQGGAVIASIPNIAHGSVRLALLHGEFRYRPTGLLDNTHLRFFTRESVRDLFESSGYHITHWDRTQKGLDETDISSPKTALTDRVRQWMLRDPDATTFQFIVRAVRNEAAELLAVTRADLAEARRELARIWSERVAGVTRHLAKLVPKGETLILADEAEMPPEVTAGLRAVPFLEKEGVYWGPPATGAVAITELERLRASGASFFAVVWPASWLLDVFPEFSSHLRTKYRCLLEYDALVLFDLR